MMEWDLQIHFVKIKYNKRRFAQKQDFRLSELGEMEAFAYQPPCSLIVFKFYERCVIWQAFE